MLTTALHSEWLKRRLGDAAVIALLVGTYLLTGCDVKKGPNEQDVAQRPTVSQRVPVTEATYTVPAEPVAPVRTTPVTYEEAETAFREGSYDRAVQLFGEYIENKPENPWGYYMLGLSAQRAGDLETAEWSFEEALARDPRHVKSMVNLSRVLIATDRADEAVIELSFALEIDSTSGEVHRLLGRAFHDQGKVDDAIDSYREAIALDETDVWAMNNLGYLLIQSGRFTEAIGPLARAVEIDSTRAVFLNNLGMALERTGYIGSARDAYARAVASDSTYQKSIANLARVEERGVDLDIDADLPLFAEAFIEEVRSRRQLASVQPEVEIVPPDSVRVPQPDSLKR